MKKRYRYILAGMVELTDSISDYRLIAGNNIKPNYHGETAIRVCVDDIVLNKCFCDSYSTTNDSRLLNELEPTFHMWDGKKWFQYEKSEEEKLEKKMRNLAIEHYMKKREENDKLVTTNPEIFWGKPCISSFFWQLREESLTYTDYPYEGQVTLVDGSKFFAACKEYVEMDEHLIIENNVCFLKNRLKVKK